VGGVPRLVPRRDATAFEAQPNNAHLLQPQSATSDRSPMQCFPLRRKFHCTWVVTPIRWCECRRTFGPEERPLTASCSAMSTLRTPFSSSDGPRIGTAGPGASPSYFTRIHAGTAQIGSRKFLQETIGGGGSRLQLSQHRVFFGSTGRSAKQIARGLSHDPLRRAAPISCRSRLASFGLALLLLFAGAIGEARAESIQEAR